LKTLVATAIAFVCLTSNLPFCSQVSGFERGILRREGFGDRGFTREGGFDFHPDRGEFHRGGDRAEAFDAMDADSVVNTDVPSSGIIPFISESNADAEVDDAVTVTPTLTNPSLVKSHFVRPDGKIDPQRALLFQDRIIARLNQRIAAETDPVKKQKFEAKLASAIARKAKTEQRIAQKGNASSTPVSAPAAAAALEAVDSDNSAQLNSALPTAQPRLTPSQRIQKLTDRVSKLRSKLAETFDPTLREQCKSLLNNLQQRLARLIQRVKTNAAAATMEAIDGTQADEANPAVPQPIPAASELFPNFAQNQYPVPRQESSINDNVPYPALTDSQLDAVLPAHVHVRVEVDLDDQPKNKRNAQALRKIKELIKE